jgi:hypothetical protein
MLFLTVVRCFVLEEKIDAARLSVIGAETELGLRLRSEVDGRRSST